MTIISLIAAIDKKNGLGKNNKLLCPLPADLQHFKKITMGKPVIMGRKTYNSIGKPLPGRFNIILSHHEMSIEGAKVVDSLSKALALITGSTEVMIIGGATVFEQALPLASRIYLTVIHHQFEADVFFPQFNKSAWYCVEKAFRKQDDKNIYDMTFYRYERYPNALK